MAPSSGTRRTWLRGLNVVFLVIGAGALAIMLHHVGWDKLSTGLRRIGLGFVLICAVHFMDIAFDSVVLRACAGAHSSRTPVLGVSAREFGRARNQRSRSVQLGRRNHQVQPAARIRARALGGRRVDRAKTWSASSPPPPSSRSQAPPRFSCSPLSTPPRLSSSLLRLGLLLRGWSVSGCCFAVLGELPLKIARAVGVSARRVDGWRETWVHVSVHWTTVSADKPRMAYRVVGQLLPRAPAP